MVEHEASVAPVEDPNGWEEIFDGAVRSGIGRAVTAGVLLLLPFLGMFTAWVQDVLGINLNTTELSTLIASVLAGAALTAYKWLANRGEWEKAVLEVHRMYEAGKELAAAHDDRVPVTPPGIDPGAGDESATRDL